MSRIFKSLAEGIEPSALRFTAQRLVDELSSIAELTIVAVGV